MKYFDNTRVSAFRRCPRRYFFRHNLDWAPKRPALPLVFGAGWHSGMDAVWADAQSPISDNVLWDNACEAFLKTWVKEGLPPEISLEDKAFFKARTPGVAFEMLSAYIKQRRDFLRQITILDIERPFAVPLQPDSTDVMYVGRLDKTYQHMGNIYVMEHKTTTLYLKPENGGPFRRDFIEGFSPNSQIDGYLHAGHMLYGDKFKGVNVDAALVHLKIHDAFKVIPIQRQIEQLDAWLHETLYWVERLKTEQLALKYNKEVYQYESFMPAFPKNTDDCFSFMTRCSYSDFCKMRANPLTYEETPDGYKIEHWSPFDELELKKIGLDKDE